jgi:hypothetical protein
MRLRLPDLVLGGILGVRCLNCLTVCDDRDAFCPCCRQPITRARPKMNTTSISGFAVAFMVIGLGIFNTLAPRLFPATPGGGINLAQLLAAGAVGAVCAVLGGILGALLGYSSEK